MEDKCEFGKYQSPCGTGELKRKTKKDNAHLILLWASKLYCLRNITGLSHEKPALSTAFNWSVPDPRIDLHPSCNMSSSCCQTDKRVWFGLMAIAE